LGNTTTSSYGQAGYGANYGGYGTAGYGVGGMGPNAGYNQNSTNPLNQNPPM